MLRFWELSPSPNNIKVRMALRYKGIDFEAMPVDPFDRKPLREVSGQDLSPVIEDKGIVLNDSEAKMCVPAKTPRPVLRSFNAISCAGCKRRVLS